MSIPSSENDPEEFPQPSASEPESEIFLSMFIAIFMVVPAGIILFLMAIADVWSLWS